MKRIRKNILKMLTILTIILTIFASMQNTAYAWVNVRMQNPTYNPLFYNNSWQNISGVGFTITGSGSNSFGVTTGFIINGPVTISFNPYLYSSATITDGTLGGGTRWWGENDNCTITATAYYSDGSTRQASYKYDLVSNKKTFTNVNYVYLGQQSIVLPAKNNNFPMTSWAVSASAYASCNLSYPRYTATSPTVQFYLNLWASYVEAGDFASGSQMDTISTQLNSMSTQINNISTQVTQASSSSIQVFKVISGKPFLEPIYGEFGTPSGASDATGLGVKAVTPVLNSSGYTELSGTLTLSQGKTMETKKVVVGGKMFLFKVIALPTYNDTATVTFGN